MKKSKTTLTLMEQIIMILVFAVAAAVSLRVFVYADSRSERNVVNDVAVNESRNAAEVLKSTGGDFARTAELLGAKETERGMEKALVSEYGDFLLSIERQESTSALLGIARVTVKNVTAGTEVYSITVKWQEATP